MRDLNELRLHNAGGVPLIWGLTASGGHEAAVSPRIGFPYILDQLTIQIGDVGVAARTGLQILIADDNDITDLNNLTGENLWAHTLDLQGGEARIPFFNYSHPLQFEPSRRVNRAPTYLKARWQTSVGGAAYVVIAHLVPLSPGD